MNKGEGEKMYRDYQDFVKRTEDLRHKEANKNQLIYNELKDKMDTNEKSILNLTKDMESVKKDIKNGFDRIEEKIEEKFGVMMDKFATKLELQQVKSDTDSNSSIIKWVIGVATTIFTSGIIFLLITK